MEKRTATDRKILTTSVIVGILVSFPITGFIYGFSVCENCDNSFVSLLTRVFTGFVEAILTTITLGASWDNEGGTISTNLRFYVFLCSVFFVFIFYLFQKRNQNKSDHN